MAVRPDFPPRPTHQRESKSLEHGGTHSGAVAPGPSVREDTRPLPPPARRPVGPGPAVPATGSLRPNDPALGLADEPQTPSGPGPSRPIQSGQTAPRSCQSTPRSYPPLEACRLPRFEFQWRHLQIKAFPRRQFRDQGSRHPAILDHDRQVFEDLVGGIQQGYAGSRPPASDNPLFTAVPVLQLRAPGLCGGQVEWPALARLEAQGLHLDAALDGQPQLAVRGQGLVLSTSTRAGPATSPRSAEMRLRACRAAACRFTSVTTLVKTS
jgi:hypothetical protein